MGVGVVVVVVGVVVIVVVIWWWLWYISSYLCSVLEDYGRS